MPAARIPGLKRQSGRWPEPFQERDYGTFLPACSPISRHYRRHVSKALDTSIAARSQTGRPSQRPPNPKLCLRSWNGEFNSRLLRPDWTVRPSDHVRWLKLAGVRRIVWEGYCNRRAIDNGPVGDETVAIREAVNNKW